MFKLMLPKGWLLFLIITVALAVAGGAYAAWTASLNLVGEIRTGSVDAVWDQQQDNQWVEVLDPDTGKLVRQPIPPEKDLAECISDLQPGQAARVVNFKVTNAYPSYTCEFILGGHIVGTVPVHISEIVATATDEAGNDVLHKELNVDVVVTRKVPDANSPTGFRCDPLEPLRVSSQLHNSDRFCAIVRLHAKQSAKMDHTYSAAVGIGLIQWNLAGAPPSILPPLGPETLVLASDNTHLVAQVRFPGPVMTTVEAAGETFTQLTFPGMETGESFFDVFFEVGQPAVQMYHRLVAVPIGARPLLRLVNVATETMENVNLYPQQQSPVDQTPGDELPPPETFMNPPFVKNEEAYQTDALFPTEIVSMQLVGQMRDVNILQVDIAPAQYNPVRQSLLLHTDVELEVLFEGGTGSFVTAQSATPFEAYNVRPLVEQSLVNGSEVFRFVDPRAFPWTCFGEELMIITHPDFISAANDLRDWKRDKGIMTTVFETGAAPGGIGATKEDIKAFIQGRYDDCLMRPSYVLLLGDAEFIAPWYRSSSGSATTGTDLDYSLLAGADLLADVGLARIPVDTAAQAQTVVDKIIGYERTPPFAPSFYNTPSFPAYFQCCRTDVVQQGRSERAYIETMELIGDALRADGYGVERLYFSDTTYEPGYAGDTTPRRYYDGTALPAAIGPGSGFLWDADSTDVLNSVNAGRFLVIHRNHGGQDGWVFPGFATADVASLANGRLLPVLFSVDCATGLFDNETAAGDYDTTNSGVYLLEAFLRKENGGVVGALGDTRNSPTWANNALTRGFADAVFPDVLPAYGGATSIRRLADILNYGKLYMFSQVGVAQTAGSVSQNSADSNNIMWHAFGDPTQEVWTSQPPVLRPIYTLEVLSDHLLVLYEEEEAVITAYQGEVPIGRAPVLNGVAQLDFVVPPDPDKPIDLSASKPGAVSLKLTATGGVDLQSEGAFGPNARRINFDPGEGRVVGEAVSDQYAALGILLVDDKATTPIIVNDAIRGGTTHSDGQSLANDADTVLPGSAGVPLTMLFAPATQRVGMYIGNGDGETTEATLTAYGAGGVEIFSVTRVGFGNDVQTFIGLDVGWPIIVRVELDYGDTLLSEEIDDLLFE